MCDAFHATAAPSILARMGAPVRAMRVSWLTSKLPPMPAISSAASL